MTSHPNEDGLVYININVDTNGTIFKFSKSNIHPSGLQFFV